MLTTAMLLLKSSLFLSLHLAGNISSFPKPLSPEEERSCLERCAQGDLEARNTLIEHNMRLVAHIIKKDYCKGLIRPVENGLKPAAPVSDRPLNRFVCHCFAPAPQYDRESLPQLQSESRL